MEGRCYVCQAGRDDRIRWADQELSEEGPVCNTCRERLGAQPEEIIFDTTIAENFRLLIPAKTVHDARKKIAALRQMVQDLNVTFDSDKDGFISPSGFLGWGLYTYFNCPTSGSHYVLFEDPNSSIGICDDGSDSKVFDFCTEDCHECKERVECLATRSRKGNTNEN